MTSQPDSGFVAVLLGKPLPQTIRFQTWDKLPRCLFNISNWALTARFFQSLPVTGPPWPAYPAPYPDFQPRVWVALSCTSQAFWLPDLLACSLLSLGSWLLHLIPLPLPVPHMAWGSRPLWTLPGIPASGYALLHSHRSIINFLPHQT